VRKRRINIDRDYRLRPIADLLFSEKELPDFISISDFDISFLSSNYFPPVFYHAIKEKPYIVGRKQFEELRNIYNDSIANYMKIKNQHKEIKDLLGDIDFIIFKGISLAETLYPMPFLRPQGDIDIIVPSDRSLTIIKIFEKGGYKPIRKPDVSRELSICLLPSKSGDRLVDVHFGFRRRDLLEVQYNELLQNAYETEMGLFLERPACLVSLALHAHYHWFILPLLNWLDIALLISRMSKEEVKMAFEFAGRWGLSKSLALSVSIACENWNLNIDYLPQIGGVKSIMALIDVISLMKNEILAKLAKAITFPILMEDDMKLSYLFDRFIYYIKGGR
jgi:hypothetical protein